jgi:hypothetical protein
MAARPWLDRLWVERVHVRASLGEILRGHYRELRLSGLEVTVVPADGDEETEVGEPALSVDRLEVDEGRLVVDAGGRRAEFELSAVLAGIGPGAEGEVRLASPRFSLAPLVALLIDPGTLEPRGQVEALEAGLRIDEGGDRIALTASSRSSSVDTGGRRIELPGISVEGEIRRDGDRYLVEARPVLPDVHEAELSAVLDAEGRLHEGQARLRGAALDTLAAFLLPLPRGAELAGLADFEIRRTGPDATGYAVDAAVDRLRLPHGAASWHLDAARVRIGGTVDAESRTTSWELRAEAVGAGIELAEANLEAAEPELRADGETDLASLETSFRAECDLPRLAGREKGWEIADAVPRLRLSARGRADAGGTEGEVSLHAGSLGRLDVDGSIAVDPAVRGAELDWSWSGARLEELAVFSRSAGLALPSWLEIEGAVSADGTLRGDLRAPTVRGALLLDGVQVASTSASEWSLEADSARARIGWRGPGETIELPEIVLDGRLVVAPLESVPLTLRAAASVDPMRATARTGGSSVELGGLGRLHGTGRWSAAQRVVEAEVEIDGVDLERWRSFLRPLTGDPFPDFAVTGALNAAAAGRWEPGRGWNGTGRASVSGSGFAHRDGSRVVEGADTDWKISLSGGGPGRSLSIDAATPVGGFLLLWGRVFGDYSDHSGRLELHYENGSPVADRGWSATGRLTVDGGSEVRATLRSSPGRPPEYEAEVAVPDLERTFRRWVRDPLSDSLSRLERMQAGGSLSASFGGSLSRDARSLKGGVRVSDGRLEGTQGSVFIRGLRLDLPIDLEWRRSADGGFEPGEGRPLIGRLEFERVAFGDVAFEQTATDLFVRADTVGLDEGLAVPFLGGVLGFEELILADSLRPARRVETGLLLSEVRLETLSKALGILPLEGMLEGYFPRVRLSGDRLEVEGDGEFEVFGGRLRVRDISGENVLSRFPELTFSAELDEIDLLQVTHTIDFGEMKGVLEGEIADCELFRWVPVRCSARFETVRRKGVPQTINVKAIGNIAILGTGGGGGQISALDRGLHKFLDRYTYEKLGVSMTLDNDRFVLRGLERRGGKELFLKGRLPFAIEVVNVQPGRAIAFRSMLDRVKRMDFADFRMER